METVFSRLPSPAKINLFLHVIGQRDDGYHLLQTAFQFIDLYDYLSFKPRKDGKIQVHMLGERLVSQQHNLIYRAARQLQNATGSSIGADIWCEKNIPLGAGLGGGSSNAATTLIALNTLWQTKLNRAELLQLGLQLGADVPVFIFGRPAFAQGIGENLSPIAAVPGAFLLLSPSIFISTAKVFQSEGLTKDSAKVSIFDFKDWQNLIAKASYLTPQAKLETKCSPTIVSKNGQVRLFGRNDLQAVALRQYPRLQYLVCRLKKTGINVTVSGSGSSVFALFATRQAASRQLKQFRGNMLNGIPAKPGLNVRSWVCNSLVEHPLNSWLD